MLTLLQGSSVKQAVKFSTADQGGRSTPTPSPSVDNGGLTNGADSA